MVVTGITILDVEEDAEITLIGNVLAFLGGVAIIAYLFLGKTVRASLPLFVYALPVTLVACLALAGAAVVAEYNDVAEYGGAGLFSWFFTSPDWYLMLYIGAVPGIMGHTFINYVLAHVPSLVVSVTLMTEPLVGTFIGVLMNESSTPGLYTWIGGPILLAGCILASVSSQRAAAAQSAQSQSPPQSAKPSHLSPPCHPDKA